MKGSDKKVAMLHVKKQYELIQKAQSDLGLSVGLIDDDLFNWRLCFQGPQNTPYEGGWYSATLKFPQDFPLSPPVMIFKTQMFHPNIYPDGRVCISILHPHEEDPLNPQERLDQKWNPILTIQAVIVSITSMLASPNLDSPANVDAAIMFKDKRNQFNKKVRILAEKSLTG